MDQRRPFRFGVAAESAPSREQWAALVRKVEDLGYATFVLADHFVNEFLPIAALMAAADATSTLRVGTFVFDNDFRKMVRQHEGCIAQVLNLAHQRSPLFS